MSMDDKQSAERAKDGTNAVDRISQLPQPILHHILSFLSQNDAVKTCALSKSWRHLWSSSPNIEFLQELFNGTKETFLAVLDNTLQGYRDQNISIHQFILQLSQLDPDSSSFLEKWVPTLISNLGVKNFCLSLFSNNSNSEYFEMPPILLESESLNELYLIRCKLIQISSKCLKTLYLDQVYITDETLEKTLLECPLVEDLTLYRCDELRIVKVNKPCNLKRFEFVSRNYNPNRVEADDRRSIEINVAALETIRIVNVADWHNHSKHVFPCLSTLYLSKVKLSKESLFDTFSYNFPCVEKLELDRCYGFEELQLVSRSVKRLKIVCSCTSISKVVVDAPKLVRFEYNGCIPPSATSVTTTSSEWKSNIFVYWKRDASLSWLLKLNEILKALSRSEISMDISYHPFENERVEDIGDGLCEPVVVEQLGLTLISSSSLSLDFVNNLFRVCRPRNMSQYWYDDPSFTYTKEQNQTTEFLWKVLVQEREIGAHFWQRDLEEVRVEVWDEKGQKWHRVLGTSLVECVSLLPNVQVRQVVRFQLKWRENI